MHRIPFGVSRLDAHVSGGAPAGSVVLLAGEAGAGAREFLYTSAVINGLARTDADLFDLHYGGVGEQATLPDAVHYLSFTASEDGLREEMAYTIDPDIVEAGLDAVTFADLSPEFFELSPVPREWYAGDRHRLEDLGKGRGNARSVIQALADYVDEHAPGNLLLVDSVTDLVGTHQADVEWSDIVYLLKGLRKAARSWEGVILLHVSLEALSDRQLGDLMASVDGTMLFEWESGGNERARTMVVREFRGVLSRLEEEDIVRFETEIHEAGFDISNVRKIR